MLGSATPPFASLEAGETIGNETDVGSDDDSTRAVASDAVIFRRDVTPPSGLRAINPEALK